MLVGLVGFLVLFFFFKYLVHFQDHHQSLLVIFSEANMFTCLLSLFKSHSFSFSNQLQTEKISQKRLEEKLYCDDFMMI